MTGRPRVVPNDPSLLTRSEGNDTMCSPFFPNFYPRDFSVQQTFKCDDATKDNCRLELIFTDFQIAFMSSLEVRSSLAD